MIDLFGIKAKKHYKQKEKGLKRERKDLERAQREFEEGGRELERAVPQRIEESRMDRERGRKEGRAYAEDVLSREYQGLSPEQRRAMQSAANRNIRRQTQGENRRLLAEQGRRGIRGGTAFAQSQELQRGAQSARNKAQYDLDQMDRDLALKKMAAAFNIEQGEATQSALDREAAREELRAEQERRRQRRYEDKFNRLFSRV